jgi:hypothetical protein
MVSAIFETEVDQPLKMALAASTRFGSASVGILQK